MSATQGCEGPEEVFRETASNGEPGPGPSLWDGLRGVWLLAGWGERGRREPKAVAGGEAPDPSAFGSMEAGEGGGLSKA